MPNDMHVHFREKGLLDFAVNATARNFHHAVAMPNLNEPIINYDKAINYYQQIQKVLKFPHFRPLMTLYLNNSINEKDIQLAADDRRVIGIKLYPAGVTTNSEKGVADISQSFKVFALMEKYSLPLLVHGEVSDKTTDIFDREKLFIDELIKISKNFPNLKIIFEHISTKDAVQFVENSSDFIAATITPQHLVFNRNDLLSGGIRPHHYCLPVLKREEHRQALCKAAASGNAKFFLGSDSAPHFKNQKESSCGCAGIFSANNAIEIYLTIFDELNALEKFEDFATNNSCNFYGLEKSNKKLILEKKSQQIPSSLTVESEEIIPLMANQSISWSIVKEL